MLVKVNVLLKKLKNEDNKLNLCVRKISKFNFKKTMKKKIKQTFFEN